MEDLSLYKNLYNENYTDARKNELIQKVFENSTKAMLSEKSETLKMAQGGVLEDKVYTPYEFLHELLPKVYGRPYIVSDEQGDEYNKKISKHEKELEEYTASKLAEYGVNSLYKIDNKSLIEEIEIRRRKIISDKSFITESELEAYLFCHPELHSEHYFKKAPIFDKDKIDYFRSQGLIMVDYDLKNNSFNYVYVYEYLSGNIYEKTTRLRLNLDRLKELEVISDEQFENQLSALRKSLPTMAKITNNLDTCIFILPKSEFGKEFRISPEEVMDVKIPYSLSFTDTFKYWTETELDKALIKKSRTLQEVHTYFTDMKGKETNENERDYSDRRKKAYLDGRVILLEFLDKGLTGNCKTRLEEEWNRKYNNYAEPKYYKIPVACQLSNKFKNGKEFIPNETQIQSIQYMKSVGSGLLAYGVGVGKTASSILNLSYALDNNICKKPVFIVPNATYSKWKMEMFGGTKQIFEVDYLENEKPSSLSFDDEKKATKFAKAVNGKLKTKIEKINGHLPHHTKILELKNLNEEVVRSIKTYTPSEEKQFKTINEVIDILKELPKDFAFDDSAINKDIKDRYDDFEIDNIKTEYDTYVNDGFNAWWDKRKNRELVDYNYYKGKEYYIENLVEFTLKEYFERGIKIYRKELAYVLGSLKPIEDGTIFIATYEALEHLGFVMKDNFELRDNEGLFGRLFNEISQGDDIEDANYNVARNLPVLWRDAVYGKIKTKIDIRDLGFDYAVFDESHLMKKVLMDSKGLPTYRTRGTSGTKIREDRKYGFGEGELPSATSLVGYLVTRYIQENNNNKNVIHLTATPFTNKPAEIFSMLSLTNKKMLLDANIKYMEQFFDLYMDISFELIFGNTGVTRKESLLGYRNLPQLRNLIYSMMDYKSGEDANIKRPEKLLFPSVENNIETTLPETAVQDELFKQIKDYQRGRIEYNELCADAIQDIDVEELSEEELLNIINEKGNDSQKEKFETLEKPLEEDEFNDLKNTVKKILEKQKELSENEITDKSEKDAFRVVKGLTLLKAVTLSPYLSTCQKEAGIEPTYRQYVESSPKIKYAIECIKTIHDYELENNLVKSGCVIYMNLGVNVSFKKDGKTFKWKESGFEKIKQYLINVMGYSAEEVSTVSGSLPPIEKERAKNKFLSGKSTVLIGSSTISTGVDLQNNASALFLCSYDWNPTDNEQIAGRIHRQGNKFAKVRIVYPMVMNSADPNIFQQLYEKTLRIKNIWDRNDKGNTLDLKDFDVNSLRKGILDEPEDLAVYWKEEQTEELETLDIVLDRRLDDLRRASSDKSTLDQYTPVMKGMIVVLDAYKKLNNKKEKELELQNKLNEVDEKYEDIEDLEEKFTKIGKEKAKITKESYDFKNDPEGKYRVLTYDEIGDGEDLLKEVNKYLTNSDSVFNKLFDSAKKDIYRNWLQENFPRFNKGFYDLSKPESEDTRLYVDFDSQQPTIYANKWKGANRGFNKIKENLVLLGITFDEIPEAVDLINQQREKIKQDLEDIKQKLPEKLKEFILAKENRQMIQPTIQQRVDEFASYNEILKEIVITFKEDKAKFVESPTEKLEIKPKKKQKTIEQKIEEAVLIDEEKTTESKSDVNTTDLIENLKKGLLVRFSFKVDDTKTNFVDLFYEEGEFIKYGLLENEKGEVLSEDETTISEQELIQYYIDNNANFLEEFYDDGSEEEIVINKPDEAKSKKELFLELIDGYKLALEIESNEEKIKLYNDLIEGYQLSLELEN